MYANLAMVLMYSLANTSDSECILIFIDMRYTDIYSLSHVFAECRMYSLNGECIRE